jgi:FkbM family methyltransferase
MKSQTNQGASALLSKIHHYVHAIEFRLFLILELMRLKNLHGRRILPDLWKEVLIHPAHAEDWVNLLCFLDPDDKVLLIDIGANEGHWAKNFAGIFPKTELIAFEPSPAAYKKLSRNTRMIRNRRLFDVALSNMDGPRILEIGNDERLSSFERYSEFVNQYRQNRPTRYKEVMCRRLDGFRIDPRNRKVCLKIDVQGHEAFVLEGASETLKAVDLCLCELTFAHEYERLDPSFSVAVQMLSQHDLYPIVFQDYGRALSNHAYERDVLFVKKSLLENIWYRQPR